MTLEIIETDKAFLDIVQLADYIAEHGSLEASERVVLAIRNTYGNLAAFPRIGKDQSFGSGVPGLRMVPVSRFPNYLIFFQVTADQLIIRRVLHGSRDVESALP